MNRPILLSIQVGKPRTRGSVSATNAMDQKWRSGIYKSPVSGPIWLGRTNLTGDGQADLRVHGGPEQAALCYAASHYSTWRETLAILDMPFGGFGENFTIDGLDEGSVCIGDTYAIGETRVQVSRPRGPCWKLERRWRRPGLVEMVWQNGWAGWYVRVLQEGNVEAGMEVVLLDRPEGARTVAEAIDARRPSR